MKWFRELDGDGDEVVSCSIYHAPSLIIKELNNLGKYLYVAEKIRNS